MEWPGSSEGGKFEAKIHRWYENLQRTISKPATSPTTPQTRVAIAKFRVMRLSYENFCNSIRVVFSFFLILKAKVLNKWCFHSTFFCSSFLFLPGVTAIFFFFACSFFPSSVFFVLCPSASFTGGSSNKILTEGV